MQEVAVATQDPILICGEHTLLWSTVGKVALFFHQTGLTWNRPLKDRSYHAVVMSLCRDPNNRFPISNLLRMARKFQATDPRDKLFALYGLAGDIPGPRENPAFEIDYSKPASEIYRRFVLGHLNLYGSPDILIDVDESQTGTVGELPSWVPDWSAPLLEAHRPHSLMINGTTESYSSSAGFNAIVISQPSEQDVQYSRLGLLYTTKYYGCQIRSKTRIMTFYLLSDVPGCSCAYGTKPTVG